MKKYKSPLGKEKGGDNMKKITKNVLASAMTLALAVPMVALATSGNEDLNINLFEGFFGTNSLSQIIQGLITTIMSLLGVIAVLIFLWGGFIWMTSTGDEDKVKKAKDMILTSIIGLAIIFASWAIAMFVIGALTTATGANVVGG